MIDSKIFGQSSFLSGATTRHNICMMYVSLAEKKTETNFISLFINKANYVCCQ